MLQSLQTYRYMLVQMGLIKQRLLSLCVSVQLGAISTGPVLNESPAASHTLTQPIEDGNGLLPGDAGI